MPSKRTCYCIIAPDPTKGLSIIGTDGKPFHHLKFGDGKFRDAYLTENPTFCAEENTNSQVEIRETLNKDAQAKERRIGKYLEWTYIKHPSYDGEYYGTEWYIVKSREDNGVPRLTAQQQCQKLVQLLSAFKTYNWRQDVKQPLDVVMEDIHNNCEFR